jgi:hypothetical protein
MQINKLIFTKHVESNLSVKTVFLLINRGGHDKSDTTIIWIDLYI